MKRDPELLREILFKIEDDVDVLTQDMHTEKNRVIHGHVELLEDDGLVECDPLHNIAGVPIKYRSIRLTSTGHDVLDALRDDDGTPAMKERISMRLKAMLPYAPTVVDLLLKLFGASPSP